MSLPLPRIHPRAAATFAVFLTAAGVMLLHPVAGFGSDEDPFTTYRSFPPDSVEARHAAILSGPEWFQDIFDSLLVAADLEDSEQAAVFETAGLDYLAATGDSLLLSDYEFVSNIPKETRPDWYQTVVTDVRGWILRDEGDVQESAIAFREAAEGYRRLNHLRREAVAWGSLGVSFFMLGEWDSVETAYTNALDARRRLGDPVLIGRTLNGMGSVNFQRANYDTALAYYEQARAVREALDNPGELGTTLGYIGNVHYKRGDLEQARISYTKALEVFGEAGEGMIHPARSGLANIYAELGEHRKAIDLYRQQLALAETQNDQQEAAKMHTNIAVELRAIGDQEGAFRELGMARGILESLGDTFNLARTVNAVGLVYANLGDFANAMEQFQEAERLASESENKAALWDAKTNFGWVYQEKGLFERAIKTFEEALAMDSENQLRSRDVYSLMAEAYEDHGDLDKALELYRRTLALDEELKSTARVAMDRINIGNVYYAMKRFDEQLVEYREAAEIASNLELSEILWRSYYGIADCYEIAGVLDSARVYNDKAIEVMETLRGRSLSEETKTAFLEKRAEVYEVQVHVLGKLHARSPDGRFAEEAFAVAERGKARALLDAIAEGRVDLESGVDPVLAQQRESLERAVTSARYRLRRADQTTPADTVRALKRRIRDLERELSRVAEEIRLNNPHFAALDAGKPSTIDEIRDGLLDDDSALLEFSLGDSASYLWAVTSKDVAFYRLPPRETIESAVGRFRTGLTNPLPAGDEALVQGGVSLYELLIEPVSKILSRKKTLYVIPDGALHLIPFDVLLTEKPAAMPPPEGDERNRYFSELPYAFTKTRLRYGPSATTLVSLATASRARAAAGDPTLLAVGAPIFDAEQDTAKVADPQGLRGGLDPLPYTRDEVEAIGSLFDESNRLLLLGRDARELRIVEPGLLSRYRILHFATHGLIDERRPEQSRLALSYPQDPSEDGYLQASEIYRLELGADLVVLSACETGLGKMVRGEGVLGLPRAFFYGGATSVLVSLWSVADRSTAELMTAFYTELVRNGASPAEALIRAKGRLRGTGSFAHPFYWSPFVVMGAS